MWQSSKLHKCEDVVFHNLFTKPTNFSLIKAKNQQETNPKSCRFFYDKQYDIHLHNTTALNCKITPQNEA